MEFVGIAMVVGQTVGEHENVCRKRRVLKSLFDLTPPVTSPNTTEDTPEDPVGDPIGFRRSKLTRASSAHTVVDISDAMKWWQADAWAETIPDVMQFFQTLFFEFLPTCISGPCCALVNGRAEAINRAVFPASDSLMLFIIQTCCFQFPVWTLVLVFAIFQPEEVSRFEIAITLKLLLWRAACLSMKYTYLPPSDQIRLRKSTWWSTSGAKKRTLGAHIYFKADCQLHMEHLIKSACRVGLLMELSSYKITTDSLTATHIWQIVKIELESLNELRGPYARHSKYGDVQAYLGLNDLDELERLASDGVLPVAVLALYFVSIAYRPLPTRTQKCVMLFGISLGFVSPIVLAINGLPPFGTSTAAKVVYCLRIYAIGTLAPNFLFCVFPLIDGVKRLVMSTSVLAVFGCGISRGLRLTRGYEDPELEIKTFNDLMAFWALVRLLGPAFNAGISLRYNSAYVAVHVCFMCLGTGGLVAARASGETLPNVIVELSILFAAGAASVVLASLVCVTLNNQLPLYCSIATRAALRYHRELGAVAKDIIRDLQTEHGVLHPVKMMYMPATPALLSFFWSGLALITGVFASAVRRTDQPFATLFGL